MGIDEQQLLAFNLVKSSYSNAKVDQAISSEITAPGIKRLQVWRGNSFPFIYQAKVSQEMVVSEGLF